MDPLEYLFSLERLGMKFGLENMRALCDALGHPERSFASVIVGGTNGKGSVTSMVATALSASGHRTGRYTSPHLERLEERFNVDGADVATPELRAAAASVQAAAERLVREGVLEGPATFFECATAIAFELFRAKGVSIAVLEVGLGGRLDATNVVTPLAAAITSIDFDHQAQLGTTLESIAYEKAGIVKAGIPVVCGPLPEAAAHVIRDACHARGATFIAAGERVRADSRVTPGGTIVSLHSTRHHLDEIRLALPGRHQVANAQVALCLLEALSSAGWSLSDAAIHDALTSSHWPARLEHRRWNGAELLLDAAHNPAGARSLAAYLSDLEWPPVALVFGAMRDKDVAGILEPLVPLCSRIICTTPGNPRSMPSHETAALVRRLAGPDLDVEAIDPAESALRSAVASRTRVVVAGSIFLVGPLRGILR